MHLKDDVDVLILPTNREFSSSIRGACESCMTLDEVERCDQFAFDHLRQNYQLSRWVLRQGLASYLVGVDARELRFGLHQFGRPFLKGYSTDLEFNLSHTDGLIALAVSKAIPLGLDVEKVPHHFMEDVAKGSFSKVEYNDLMERPSLQRNDYFCQLWTLKEAYIKALGVGLSTALDDFSFRFKTSDILEFRPKTKGEKWAFKLYDVCGCKMSLCHEDRDQTVSVKFYEFRENADGDLTLSGYSPQLIAQSG